MDNLYLSLLLLFLLFDFLTAATLHVYRTVRDLDVFSTVVDDGRTNLSHSVRLLENPHLIDILRLADKSLSIITAVIAALFAVHTWCLYMRFWMALIIALGLSLLLSFLENCVCRLVSHNPQKAANFLAPICHIITSFYGPFYNLFSHMIPEPVVDEKPDMEEVENHLRDWVENIPDNALLEQGERKMIRSIVHFSNTLIREIMIPRIDVTALDVDTPLKDAAQVVLSSGHSRLPVYEDEIDNIIGVLYAKDLLKVILDERESSLRDLLRKPLFAPEAKKAGDLLNEMQESGIHIVVVVDEYGGTSGIVSMEDIVEEIVGEIRDEYDEREEQLVRKLGADEYSFLGRIDLEDVNEYLGIHLTRESADTLAGFLYSRIGKVPVGNEKVEVEGWLFQIEELSGRRIRRVYVSKAISEDQKGCSKKEDQEKNETN